MDILYEFDGFEKSLRRYGGSDKKASVKLKNDFYMIKFSDRAATNERGELGTSYRNSALSEYISCHILNEIGISAQETLLGYKDNKLVVACKDFCTDGFRLNEFSKYAVTSDEEFGRYPDINKVVGIIGSIPELPHKDAEIIFWDMFVADAVLGNFDRHSENWGYLYNEKTGEVKTAPVYDCGSCLYPQLSDCGMKDVLNSVSAIEERIYKYPESAFSLNDRKISYCGFLTSTDNEKCMQSVLKLSDKLNMKIVEKVIQDTPAISDIRREFYRTMIGERINKILKPAEEHAKEKIRNTDI